MDHDFLMEQALAARQNAYCPYSGFAVGAALLCTNGTVYTGCNIECASLSPGNCAERTAMFRAVADGQRQFTAIAVAGGPAGKEPSSFCAPNFEIILYDGREQKRMTLEELLPMAFGPDNLKGV